MEEYWYQEYESKIFCKFPAMARKPISHFVPLLSAICPIEAELDPISPQNAIHESEYDSQNAIKSSLDTT
jgi:hypothetical protein